MQPDPAQLAADPDTPPAQLLALAGRFPAAFCANPLLPLLPLELPDLPERMGADALGALLRYAGVPADLLAFFAGYPDPAIAQLARQHVALAGEAGADWPRQAALAARPLVPAAPDDLLLDLLFLGAVPAWLQAALGDDAATRAPVPTPLDYAPPAGLIVPEPLVERGLHQLAEHERPAVRAFVAAHPLAGGALLEQIARREDWTEADYHVYAAIAENPRTPPATLARFAAEQTWLGTGRRLRVAHNPAAPPEALASLLADLAADVRRAALRHPGLPADLRERTRLASLEAAAVSSEPLVRAVALCHTADEAALQAAALSPCWAERLAVALNPRCPPEALQMLADDGHRLVRAAARTTSDVAFR